MGFTPDRVSSGVGRTAIHRIAPVAALALLLVACSSPKPEGGGRQPGAATKRPAGSIPPAIFPPDNHLASWSGTFAGTSNWSERWTLQVRPDSIYFLREEHVGHGEAGSDHAVDDIGRWEKATDGGPLRLEGGRVRSLELEVRNADTLRLPTVGPLAGDSPRDLVRSIPPASFEPRLTLTGRFRYMADAANFEECTTGLRLPVLMEGDYLAAEQSYSRMAGTPGAPFLMEMEGRITQRPGPDGGPLRDHLYIERFITTLPGDACPPNGD